MKKTNPKRIPANKADVDNAFDKGVHEGIRSANAIFLTVLVDKYGFSKDEVVEFWAAVCKLSEEIAEKRVSIADLKYVLLKEYEISA